MTNSITITNARIESVTIDRKGHGIWSAWINLDYGDGMQGYGGYNLASPVHMGAFILGACDAIGVDAWEDLPGQIVRVRCSGPGLSTTIHAIGHLLKDQWFDARATMASLKDGEA